MPKGGARTRSGPPPDPNSLTSADGEWTILPASGRPGPPPKWPLPAPMVPSKDGPEVLEEIQARELEVWAGLWSLPQAIEWERLHQEHLVGLYVRRLVEAEVVASSVSLSTLVRQLADELSLTTGGMLRNRLRVGPAASTVGETPGPVRQSAKARLQVVKPGGAA